MREIVGKKFCLILLCVTVSGCASVGGHPETVVTTEETIQSLKPYFEASKQQEYETAAEEQARQRIRNQIVYNQMRAIDTRFHDFSKSLGVENSLTHTGLDASTISLSVWAALTGGSIGQNLAGIAGGLTGIKGSIDKNIYYEKTMPALVAAMKAERTRIRLVIDTGLKTDTKTYPLSRALLDVGDYYESGTFSGALASIVEKAAATTQATQEIRLNDLTEEALSDEVLDKADALVDAVDKLPKGAAPKLMRNPPFKNPDAEQVIIQLDPGFRRLSDDAVAKQMIKTRLSYARTKKETDAWEAALKGASATPNQ